MSADDLLSLLTRVLFGLLFISVTAQAIRRPLRANIDAALLFASIALVVAITIALDFGWLPEAPILTSIILIALNAWPVLLLRLTEDFTRSPRWLTVAATVIFLGLVAIDLLAGQPVTNLVLLTSLAWFVGVGGYAASAFFREARRTRGITSRRMLAVAFGALGIVAAIVMALAGAVVPELAPFVSVLVQLLALGSAIAFFIGLTPPPQLRRLWQEPELREFIDHSLRLVGAPDLQTAIRRLERGAADAVGAPGASIGMHNPDNDTLVYVQDDGTPYPTRSDAMIGGRAFTRQAAVMSRDAPSDDPEHAEVYRTYNSIALLAAPMTAGDDRLGTLAVFAERAPIFAEDDLRLVQLLADQAAVVLQARMNTDATANLKAREEATRLKEDFLSAAAHDLRTPLTVLLGQSELLARRIARDPQAPVDAASVDRIVGEARRLRSLINALLDAERLEQGALVGVREPIDLDALLAAVAARRHEEAWELTRATSPLIGSYDRTRMEQVLDNLLDNARKYSPPLAPVRLRAWRQGGEGRISVADKGIGIPADDLPRIFERFYRASNVDDRQHSGMGLGLFICKRIVEEHGGRLWAESRPGHGSTFHIALPLEATGASDVTNDAAVEQRAPIPQAGRAGELAADA